MKFSIVTPSFNQADFVEKTLKSVKIQIDVEYEHLIFDAVSTDGTTDIL
ncbi:MAG: glycosyltransferase, partial [Paracoccus hibiscisoli]